MDSPIKWSNNNLKKPISLSLTLSGKKCKQPVITLLVLRFNREVAHFASLVSLWPASASSPCLFLSSLSCLVAASLATMQRLRCLCPLPQRPLFPGSHGLLCLLLPLLPLRIPPSPCCSHRSGMFVRDDVVAVAMLLVNGCFGCSHVSHVIPPNLLSYVSCHTTRGSAVMSIVPWKELTFNSNWRISLKIVAFCSLTEWAVGRRNTPFIMHRFAWLCTSGNGCFLFGPHIDH